MQKTIKLDLPTSITFLMTLLFYIALKMLDINLISTVGKYALISFTFLILILLIHKRPISKNEIFLFSPFLLFCLIYLVNVNFGTDTSGLMIVANQTFYLFIIYMIYSISWTRYQVLSLSYLYYVSLPIIFILIFVLPSSLNTNTIGSYVYFLSFFPLLYLVGYAKNLKKTSILLISSITLFAVLAVDARSILLSAAFGFMTFSLWKFITSRKILFNLYFILILVFNYFVIVIYPNMRYWSNFQELNELSLRFTGKDLMSGRNTIWVQLVDIISLKPWFGYGSSIEPEDFLTHSLSAHNLYIQIGLQVGLIGVSLLILFFFVIWKSFWKNRFDIKVRLTSCFFVGILIHQTFEVTLTQNQFSIGLVQWLIVAFGLSFTLKKNQES